MKNKIGQKQVTIDPRRLAKVKCSICGSAQSKTLFHKEGFRFVRCANCGFVYVNPRLSDRELKRFYESSDMYWSAQDSAQVRGLLKKKFDDELARIERHIPKGRVLDVGCAAGVFLYHARARGWQVAGAEHSKGAREYLKSELGMEQIYPGELTKLKPRSFDLVTMHQVLEHSPNPDRMVAQGGRLLREGGLLFISVPNTKGITGRIMGQECGHYVGDVHLSYFSRKDLRVLLERNGFEIIGFATESFMAEPLLAYIKSKALFWKPQQPQTLDTGTTKRREQSRLMFHAYYAICAVLNAFALGDYFNVLARKK